VYVLGMGRSDHTRKDVDSCGKQPVSYTGRTPQRPQISTHAVLMNQRSNI
jgi:hypothetical protein